MSSLAIGALHIYPHGRISAVTLKSTSRTTCTLSSSSVGSRAGCFRSSLVLRTGGCVLGFRHNTFSFTLCSRIKTQTDDQIFKAIAYGGQAYSIAAAIAGGVFGRRCPPSTRAGEQTSTGGPALVPLTTKQRKCVCIVCQMNSHKSK